jgi:hypothetical protein
VQGHLGKNQDTQMQKNRIRAKRAGSVTQVVEHLLSKHKSLSSSPSTERERNLPVSEIFVWFT